MGRSGEGRARPLAAAGPALAAVLALALALALALVACCGVEAVFLSPVPFARPSDLVMVWESRPADGVGHNPVSRPNFVDWRRDNSVFTGMAAFYVGAGTLTGGSEPERVRLAVATAALFPLLGARAEVGRVFTEAEDRPGFDQVAVLSDDLWRRSYGADPSVVGRTVQLDGLDLEVLGVLAPGFELPRGVDLWAPIAMNPQDLGKRGGRHLSVLARLKEGVSLEQATAGMQELARRLEQQYPDAQTGWSAEVVPLLRELQGAARPGAVVLLVMALLLWVFATFTAASWLRSPAAAGSLAPRVARPLPVILVAVAAGLGLGAWAVTALSGLAPADLPDAGRLRLGGFAIAITALLAAASWLWLLLRAPAGSLARPGSRALKGVAVLQIVVTSVLLSGTLLLALSFGRLRGTEPGFDPHDLLAVALELPRAKYPDREAVVAFTRTLLGRLEALPGVESAAVASALPVSGIPRLWNNSFEVVGRPPAPAGEKTRSHLRWATRGYFHTLGIPLLRGRSFAATDQRSDPPVMVIDEEMSREYFAGEEPLGQEVIVRVDEPVPRRIVGVVATVKQRGLDEPPVPHMYLPQSQTPPAYLGSGWLVVRARARAEELASTVRAEIRGLDPDLPVATPKTMEERITASVAGPRFELGLVSAVAAVAFGLCLLLAAGLARAWPAAGGRGSFRGLPLAVGGALVGILVFLVMGPRISQSLFGIGPAEIVLAAVVAQVFLVVLVVAAAAAGRRGLTQETGGGAAAQVGPSKPEGQS
jgi:putative ABC transport system permease protein